MAIKGCNSKNPGIRDTPRICLKLKIGVLESAKIGAEHNCVHFASIWHLWRNLYLWGEALIFATHIPAHRSDYTALCHAGFVSHAFYVTTETYLCITRDYIWLPLPRTLVCAAWAKYWVATCYSSDSFGTGYTSYLPTLLLSQVLILDG